MDISKNMYWTKETHAAIITYQQTKDEVLFTQKIYPAFKILCNYWCALYKNDICTDDAITHLYMQINKFDPSKTNSFSYFGTCVKFYLLNFQKNRNKKHARECIEVDNPDCILVHDDLIEQSKNKIDLYILDEDISDEERKYLNELIEKMESCPATYSSCKNLNNTKIRKHVYEDVDGSEIEGMINYRRRKDLIKKIGYCWGNEME